jgi:VCBS repeat-containing protein
LSTATPSSSPQADSVLQGTYGTLDLAQNGTWQYFLNPGLPSVKALGPGETAHDNFQVTATAADGAHSSQTISINVLGPPTVAVTVLTPDGMDFQAHNVLREMGAGTIQPGTTTSFTILDSADDREFVIDGSNFTYSDGLVTGGTITAFHAFKADGITALADLSGLSVDAPTWITAVQQDAAGDHSAIEALTSKYSYKFIGGAGSDSFGSAGHNDLLIGGAGNDTLDPGGAPAGGHDTVTGGAGSDTFLYHAGYGAVTITDFDQGNSGSFNVSEHDKLEINGFSGDPNPNISPDGHGNTTVDFGNGDVLTLLGVADASQIPKSDIIGGNGNNGGDGGGGDGGGNSGRPVFSNADNAVTYAGTPVTLDSTIGLTDTAATVSSVNVWISSGFHAGDTLSVSGSNVTGDGTDGTIADADGTTIHYHLDTTTIANEPQLFLSGISVINPPTTADFELALQQIQFSPGAADGDRTVTWAAYDNNLYSPAVTTTVHVGPILNSFTLNISEGGTTLLSDNNFSITNELPTDFFSLELGTVHGGEFQVRQDNGVTWPSAPTGGFTVAQIEAGDVRFVQNGSATVPDFSIHVSNGTHAGPDIAPNVSLEIAGANSQTISFSGSSGTLQLDDPASFNGQIAGISGTGDVLDLHGFKAATTTAATGNGSYNGTITTLTVHDSSDDVTESFNLVGNYSASTWNVTDDHNGGANIVDPPAGSQTQSQTIVASVPNETLTGSGTSNTYVFNFTGFGHDTVTDFDALQFSAGILPNAQAALNATQDDGHGNTVLTPDAGDAIILSGVVKAQLHAADFHFV